MSDKGDKKEHRGLWNVGAGLLVGYGICLFILINAVLLVGGIRLLEWLIFL